MRGIMGHAIDDVSSWREPRVAARRAPPTVYHEIYGGILVHVYVPQHRSCQVSCTVAFEQVLNYIVLRNFFAANFCYILVAKPESRLQITTNFNS